MSLTFPERLMQAVERLGKNDNERAKVLGYSARQIQNWRNGKDLDRLQRLEAAGVLHLNDGSCTCSPRQNTN